MSDDFKTLLRMKLERVRHNIKQASDAGEKDKETFYNGYELGLLEVLELLYLYN